MKPKAKKAAKNKLKKSSFHLSIATGKKETSDFLPLEGGPGHKIRAEEIPAFNSNVLYIGHIPHGFYEKEMEGYFKQFGRIRRLRISRNKKTGKSRHYGFIEFEDAQVAKIVADSMHNYHLFEHMLQVIPVPPDKVHRSLFKGIRGNYVPPKWAEMERKERNKDRTLEERNKIICRVVKLGQSRKKKIDAMGFDYQCPEIVGDVKVVSKKVKFEDE